MFNKELLKLLDIDTDSEYEEKPVTIDVFIRDIVPIHDAIYPGVRKVLYEIFGKRTLGAEYREAIVVAGIGFGKSMLSAVAIAYVVYQLLCLKDPAEYFNLLPGSPIHITNTSTTATQAKKIVFGYLKDILSMSTWFDGKYDRKVESELRFIKNITVIPGSSSETSPIGLNLFCAVMDEASWYVETDRRDQAENIYNTLSKRITSRFRNNGLLMIVTSPAYPDDFAERKIKQAEALIAQKGKSHIYAVRKATWDNGAYEEPFVDFMGYKIPESFVPDFEIDPDRAMRDFLAIPSAAIDRFIPLSAIANAKRKENEIEIITGGGYVNFEFKKKPEEKDPYAHYLHIDLGATRDRCGFVCAHKRGQEIVVDFAGAFDAKDFKDGEVDFDLVERLVLEAKQRYNIAQVSFDRWQSVQMRQRLQKNGVFVVEFNIDTDVGKWTPLRNAMVEGKVVLPECDLLIKELDMLELIKGKKVDHPRHGSKDIADALGSVVNFLYGEPAIQFGRPQTSMLTAKPRRVSGRF